MAEEGEIIEFLTISMARITGTLLLSVYNYNLSRALVSRSALGILLIILALILAHTDLLNTGRICAIPTDLGYVLAASCHFSESVQKIFQINTISEDAEIMISITSLVHQHQSKYDCNRKICNFINSLWPYPVGLVLPNKGKCLDNLGLANSSSLLGSSKNIILYTSDYEVTTQIIDLVGPIAVRLLGMRTQGLMLSNLPKEVDGILIDDMQNNDYEFTIIDCMDVDRGKIEIIKEGAVSTSQVMDVLHAVNAREESSNIQNSIRL
ncbi:uncharacterized protein [Hyperolius riggenbachi]|uniref:uncharacterized protein isoform X9 n=1 Tax=Hyperolius riggenbachi TaxID=752182 RepID=UPI0035A38120